MRFPGFSGEWEKHNVSDILDFYSTNSLSWDQLEYDNDGLFNLHYGLIHVGLPTLVDLQSSKLPTIKAECMPKNYELCQEGDIAFADASEDTNEVAKAIEFTNLASKNVVCGLHTIHGRDKGNQTVVGFKGYAFSSKAFHDQIKKIAQGTKIYSISCKSFNECTIGIPSKEEQKKIADLMSKIDLRIATQIKVIEKLESLMKGLVVNTMSFKFEKKRLSDLLEERIQYNKESFEVCSVSVSQGVINQVDYLGRSFAAKDTSKYHVVHNGDIVYTKSPTGDFPYGIVKRSFLQRNVAVSPLYGVYKPINDYVGIYLHHYFDVSSNTFNYLHPLIQKGAKNTINITNQRFLENDVLIPTSDYLPRIVDALNKIQDKLILEKQCLSNMQLQKQYLLQKIFI